MTDLHVAVVRGALTESTHRISVAVVGPDGRTVAAAGAPGLTTYWRSAAKPYQVMPFVEDGGVETYHLDRRMLALACSSHNAEPVHREVASHWLEVVGVTEDDLACGGHRSLWPSLAEQMIRDDITPTPVWSNCSGKHAAMLAQARMHGWPLAGYQRLEHPVQQRIAATVAEWSGVDASALGWGVDGCTAAAVALPLSAMALAYARLGTSPAAAARQIRDAMMGEPYLIAGADRLDTALMQAWPGRIVVKTGAEGVFGATLPGLGLGIAIKVEDGDGHAAGMALVDVLEQVTRRFDAGQSWPLDGLDAWRAPVIRDTRGEVTGGYQVRGALRFL